MRTERRTLQHEWFERVWNQADASAIDELLTEDVIGHGLVDSNGEEIRSRSAFKEFYLAFRGAFPDIHIDVLDVVCEGDFQVARCHVRATHSGEGFVIAPTGRQVEFTGLCMVRTRDGKIAES